MNKFLSVASSPDSNIVRVVRNSLPPETLEHMEETWGGLEQALIPLKRPDHHLLLDVRRARGRNDEAFEAVVAKHRPNTLRGFSRVAVLVSSVFGRMQIERHAREDGLSAVRAFLQEKAALAWLNST